jgi:hypothetical protein
VPAKGGITISDDQIRDSLENAQLKLQRSRGTDVTIFSPRASADGSPRRQRNHQQALERALQRTHPPRLQACIRRISSASASCRSRRVSIPRG